ncbi:hypothetical protein AB3R30_24330 [Leptolyngbyaceae cyanobacterium UHCC 1019]
MTPLTRVGISLIVAPLACLFAQLAVAQVKIQQSNFSERTVIQPTSELRLKLDRLPTPAEGKLAFFIGRTDVTSQFRSVGTEFIYQPSLFPLPPGETKVIIYLVKGNEWQEIAQLPLKVVSQPQSSKLDQPTSTQPTQAQSSAAKPSLPEQKSTDKPTDPSQSTEQAGLAPSESKKPDVAETTPTQSESAPSSQAAEEQPQKPTQLIQAKPSRSAADLSNSFQPQPLQRKSAPKLDPLHAKPDPIAADFTTTFKPRMNINVKSQFMDQRSGTTEASERPTFTDTTVETGFEAEITSGTFSVQSRFSLLGVTFQPEALRFGELGEAAPKFDLSEYQIEAKWGPVQFSMGHLCYGNHPFLMSSVCSRGMTFKVNFSDRLDISINSMNASSIVGFDNFTGLDNFNTNNMVAATVGYQLVKNDFGGIRLEATVMDGKRPAENNFNEGGVVDAEKSRGVGFRLFGTDNSGRLRIDVGYARSTFTNPPDRQLVDTSSGAEEILAEEFIEEPPILEEPTLEEPLVEAPLVEPPLDAPIIDEPIVDPPIIEEEFVEEPIPEELTDVVNGVQEIVVVPVKPVTKTAFYADISYDLLKEVKLDNTRTFSLTLNARHEQVDPQFQTLGATVTADQRRTLMGLNASIAGATIQLQQEWLEDNLANVPTVLKTKTRNTSLNVNLPLQTVLGSPSRFLPTLTYSYQRVQQFGANVPIPDLSAFDPTEIPNQINQQHQAGIQWAFDELSFGYQFSSSVQDNRQLSREQADFFNLNHQLSLSWQPTSRFQLTLGYNFASAESKEEGITRFNSSPTIGLSWEFLKNVTLALNYNTTSDRDSLNQKFAQATGLEAILTWRFTINNGAGSPIPGSAFIRYSQQSNLNRDNVFGLSTDSTVQVINAGFSISF